MKKLWVIPEICRVQTFFDHKNAGWYAEDSVYVKDCVPHFRLPGGGVQSEYLTDLESAIEQSIHHTNDRISDAERHLEILKKALEEVKCHERVK